MFFLASSCHFSAPRYQHFSFELATGWHEDPIFFDKPSFFFPKTSIGDANPSCGVHLQWIGLQENLQAPQVFPPNIGLKPVGSQPRRRPTRHHSAVEAAGTRCSPHALRHCAWKGLPAREDIANNAGTTWESWNQPKSVQVASYCHVSILEKNESYLMEWMDMHLQIYIYAHTCVNIYVCVWIAFSTETWCHKPARNEIYIYVCVCVCVCFSGST